MIVALLALALQGAWTEPPVEAVEAVEAVEVRWVGPSGCIDEQTLAQQVIDLAGQPPAPIDLEASSSERGWRIRVTYEDTRREIEAQDCAVLTEAVALIVAVRVDAVRTAAKVEPRPEPPPEPEPIPEAEAEAEAQAVPEPIPAKRPPRPEPPPTPPQRAAPVSLSPTVLLGVAGDLGTLPRGGAAMRAEVGLRRRALELDLGAVATLGPASAPQAGVRSSFRLFAGSAQACWLLESAAIEAPLCARTEVGVLQARPSGLTEPTDRDALWVAPAIRAGLAPSRGRFAPEGFLEVAAPALRHRFVFEDDRELHRLPPVVLRLGLALRWRGA